MKNHVFTPLPSKSQDNRKSHDTNRSNQRPSKG